jgi:hypothetical protein
MMSEVPTYPGIGAGRGFALLAIFHRLLFALLLLVPDGYGTRATNHGLAGSRPHLIDRTHRHIQH